MTSLLRIDNKFVIVTFEPFTILNISDLLVNHTIRKIVFNDYRVVILTTTNLYYLVFKSKDSVDDIKDHKLVDITENIKQTVNVNDILFVTNSYDATNNIGIIVTNGKLYFCQIDDHRFVAITCVNTFKNNDVVAISDKGFGYIQKVGEKCSIGILNWEMRFVEIYIVDRLPTKFASPSVILCDDNLMIGYKFNVKIEGVTHVYNRYYHVADNGIYKDEYNEPALCGIHETNTHTVLNIDGNHKIVTTNGNDPKIIKYHRKFKHYTDTKYIDTSYYHTENLGQYSNDTWNIEWTTDNHHLFDQYTKKFVEVLLRCRKYSKYQRLVPKQILYYILKFIL